MALSSTKPKWYIPLEINPDVFNALIRDLGVARLSFHDVYSIDDPDLLAVVPRPVLALVLVFPQNLPGLAWRAEEDTHRDVYTGKGDSEPVMWFQQTIHNACGLYAILHAVTNGAARSHINSGSALDNLLRISGPFAPPERAKAVESAHDIEKAYTAAAQQGDSAPPALEDEVDDHYICYVKSASGKVFEMDGRMKGPIDTGVQLAENEDLLADSVLALVKKLISDADGSPRFSLMALSEDS